MDTSGELVSTHRDSNHVLHLRLNRPSQFNALSESVLQTLQTQLDAIAQDRDVRCVVLSSAGTAFCAGHDLREMQANRRYEYYRGLFAQCTAVMQRIRALPVPVIARVQGVATAAGCQLVASCDLAVASDTARFAVSGINLGLFCSTPAVALSRTISPKRAFDLLVTGRFIDAATAVEWGLINQAVPADQLDPAIERLTGTIVSKSPCAVRYGKEMFYRQLQLPIGDAYAYAEDVMARNMMEDETAEGVAAFLGDSPRK